MPNETQDQSRMCSGHSIGLLPRPSSEDNTAGVGERQRIAFSGSQGANFATGGREHSASGSREVDGSFWQNEQAGNLERDPRTGHGRKLKVVAT
jgi:hypothetical protein